MLCVCISVTYNVIYTINRTKFFIKKKIRIKFTLPQNKPLKSYGSIIVTFLISFNLFNVRVRVPFRQIFGSKNKVNPACFLMVFFNEIKGKNFSRKCPFLYQTYLSKQPLKPTLCTNSTSLYSMTIWSLEIGILVLSVTVF